MFIKFAKIFDFGCLNFVSDHRCVRINTGISELLQCIWLILKRRNLFIKS